MGSSLSPADAFGLLADPTRYAIVEALVDRAFEDPGDTVTFSDLRRAVDVDDAGQFNYHLGKLRPQFVEKHDDGYRPRFAALEAVGAARAGTFTERPGERRGTLDVACQDCGEPLEAVHRGSSIRVECPDDGWFFQSIVPPRTAVDRTVPEVVEYAARETQRDVEKLTDGVCMLCGGSVETTVPVEDEGSADESEVIVEFDCTNCPYRMHAPLQVALFGHPAVVAHHWRHGVDLRDALLFEPAFVRLDRVTVESRDPLRVVVDVTLDGDPLHVAVDADLAVTVLED